MATKKKWTAKQDIAWDKKHGVKQGSKRDVALDKKRGVLDKEMKKKHTKARARRTKRT